MSSCKEHDIWQKKKKISNILSQIYDLAALFLPGRLEGWLCSGGHGEFLNLRPTSRLATVVWKLIIVLLDGKHHYPKQINSCKGLHNLNGVC